MSLVTCPQCARNGFTWYTGEHALRLTNWACSYCGYSATEDESAEALCPSCSTRSFLQLTDLSGTYYYCHRCGQRQST